ncbi:hypothetical protein M408DRAFT_23628 [Serendipita vermifera MAFF 305830]|uniref:Uncharacterized protein n=1 Tax=Serendipita vermifera MAFF 305830 TaxID=933852 RepID=A0A0C2WQX0_SERVB|nr:hypothetical protein M408DRAFT_23628 [Serendipita vermifera MAFF 305830]
MQTASLVPTKQVKQNGMGAFLLLLTEFIVAVHQVTDSLTIDASEIHSATFFVSTNGKLESPNCTIP